MPSRKQAACDHTSLAADEPSRIQPPSREEGSARGRAERPACIIETPSFLRLERHSPRRRLEAREAMAWECCCPDCLPLASAYDRSLALLLALLRLPRHFLLRHFTDDQSRRSLCRNEPSRALPLDPLAAVHDILIAIRTARLLPFSRSAMNSFEHLLWGRRAERRESMSARHVARCGDFQV